MAALMTTMFGGLLVLIRSHEMYQLIASTLMSLLVLMLECGVYFI